LCAVVPFVPDLASFIQYAIHLLFFLSCVMFKLENISAHVAYYVTMNPMVHILYAYRDVLLYRKLPDFVPLASTALVSVAGIVIGVVLINALNGTYAKRMV